MSKHVGKIKDILGRQQLAVISTVGPPNPDRCYPGITQDVPESALIAFAQDDDLKLYFQTGRHTRKAANLAHNPFVALVISHTLNSAPYPNVTVQYQGRVRQLKSTEDIETCKQRFEAKDSPTTERFFNDPTAIFFEVKPVWIGCSDYSTEPPQVIEIDFQA
jgi:general stress protein 26